MERIQHASAPAHPSMITRAAPYGPSSDESVPSGDDLAAVVAAVVGPFGQEAHAEMSGADSPCPNCSAAAVSPWDLGSFMREIDSCGSCGVVLAA